MRVTNVIKRNGESEEVSFDKVIARIRVLSTDLDVDFFDIAQKVCSRIYDNVKTSELDELAANICSSMIADNPDYGTLAARIIISNHHKNTSPSFSETIQLLYNNDITPLVSKELYEIVMKNKEKLNNYLDYQRDYAFDYFGFKTLERAYLLKINNKVVERPQHLFMRVSLGIHGNDIKDALQTYDYMSRKYFTHATPTLFNSGTPRPQCSSCFLLSVDGDSIDNIFDTVKECAMISKYAGGIGLHVHDVRAKGSIIKGTNGVSDGIVPMLKVINQTARYVNQSGKRNGSVAIYLEPWHADIFEFLELKKPHGNEEDRARDLFYALWIPDLFMERVKANQKWSLMCPNKCPGLSDVYGEKFVELYTKYEKEGKFNKQIDAQHLWFKILETQIESGTPYLLFKDSCNIKSNQKNLGTIKSSNLCVAPETMILTDRGYYPIEDLVGKDVNVWNGKEFSTTTVRQTGENQKLLTVRFDNGIYIRCTPYHKFYIETGFQNSNQVIVEAKDLKSGMRIVRYETPTIHTAGPDIKYAYTQGLYSICGVVIPNQKPILWLYGRKKELIKKAEWSYYTEDVNQNRFDVYLPTDIKEKYFVPINNSVPSKVAWLQGLIDGSCDGSKNVVYIRSFTRNFLFRIFLMLQTLGVQSSINNNVLKLRFSSLSHLIPLGLKLPETCNNFYESESMLAYVRVLSVEDKMEFADTYCFNEPLEHKGIFNGILTGQCTEILEYSSPDETAVCNLSSICLPTYIEYDSDKKPFFNFDKLHEVTMIITKNLNKVIDINYYPVEKARRSNLRHRPIGIGVQGLADTYVLMRYPFESQDAKDLNKKIFETIYHAAVEQSMKIAKTRYEVVMNDKLTEEQKMTYLNTNEYDPDSKTSRYPGAYLSFDGSPASQGFLQFDLWGVKPHTDRYDWDTLKEDIMKYGMRNSLLLAPMPTASTSQIMGFNEAFEAFTTNIYKRKTLAGEFIIVNKYLVKDLIRLNLWNSDMKNKIILHEGSVQSILEIPHEIRSLYKTIWEIKQRSVIDQAADRGPYICQSQSMNLFVEEPNFKILSSMHFYSWEKGLKTCSYYLRSKPRARQQQFTIEPSFKKEVEKEIKERKNLCNSEDGVCQLCSS